MGENIYREIGQKYQKDLVCIGVIERPAIILQNTKTGEKQTQVIGSHAYMRLEPAAEGAADA